MSNIWYIFRSLPYAIVGIILLVLVLIVMFGQFAPKVNHIAETIIGRILISVLIFILTIVMTINLNKLSVFVSKINTKNELDRKELDILLKEEKLKNEQLKTEVENLKHTALNVQSFKDISELCLVETDMKSTIAHTKSVKDPEKGLVKMTGEEFWLVSQYDFEGIKFGVDLNNIKVLENGNNLYIYGLKGKYIATETSNIPNDVLCEIRSYELKDGKKINIKVLDDKFQDAKKLAETYHKEDTERITKAVDNYEWIMNSCYKMGQVFVENYLRALNKTLIFASPDEENSKAISLQEYIDLQIENKLNSN
ncbi:MAG: hypothetical protein IKX70_06150 [Treponema sp.]|nr:hypothetical protein [Treponema sp.]